MDLALDQVFVEVIDKNFRVTEMPKLTLEGAKTRIGQILENKDEDPLRSLAEIQYYHTQGLLSDELFELAYKRMIGEVNGGLLLSDDPIQKQKAIAEFLP